MSERISQTILLCEDDQQARLVRCYLKVCGLHTDPPYLLPVVASREVHGGNVGWVLREFEKQLHACRQRNLARARTLLVVVADADDFTVAERRGHLVVNPPVTAADPLVVLIPRRHIETWTRAGAGETVNETESYKSPQPRKAEIHRAAATIYGWARDTPPPGPQCIASLLTALPQWRKIG